MSHVEIMKNIYSSTEQKKWKITVLFGNSTTKITQRKKSFGKR